MEDLLHARPRRVQRSLRERHVTLPVIILTARNELNERIEGLNLGADDYLTKPFFVEELVARLQGVLRRSSGTALMILQGRGKAGPTTPTGQGFEVFKQPRDLGIDKDRYFNDRGEYLTDVFTTEGIRWIEANKERPFFLYMAYHAVHSPFEPKPELLKKYREKPGGSGAREEVEYTATVEAVDENVGRIVDALERFGLSDNTVVIFHSDNGGTRHYIRPLNGGKGNSTKGGSGCRRRCVGRGSNRV